ncbi:tRNA glutamyl-Q(34) synthetase GluQRS [Ampullimonas aquatilis]|uniref:tRNA glutamyl-Q(34) synthetase GluQRS n=1 Tax=Ampullimonas aquatilis TaxID=1341549 RepID=UPI003C7090E1
MSRHATSYIGRFAPSPSGPLHIGSLVTALASWLDARAHCGQWLVRMEDVDTPRTVPGAAETILQALQVCGLHWDGEVTVQSQRGMAYQAAFDYLNSQHLTYACACTRKEIADSLTQLHGPAGAHERHATLTYPGTCRNGLQGKTARAWRIRVPDISVQSTDRWQGLQTQALADVVGDFILKRADGLWAYQLAVVVDDTEQGITHIVRGADLLDSTPRQIWLQQQLGYPAPSYMHVPLVCNAIGEKLSKQTGANPLDLQNPLSELQRALQFLGLPGEGNDISQVLATAIIHWRQRWIIVPGKLPI